jgi:hypothetical protein
MATDSPPPPSKKESWDPFNTPCTSFVKVVSVEKEEGLRNGLPHQTITEWAALDWPRYWFWYWNRTKATSVDDMNFYKPPRAPKGQYADPNIIRAVALARRKCSKVVVEISIESRVTRFQWPITTSESYGEAFSDGIWKRKERSKSTTSFKVSFLMYVIRRPNKSCLCGYRWSALIWPCPHISSHSRRRKEHVHGFRSWAPRNQRRRESPSLIFQCALSSFEI